MEILHVSAECFPMAKAGGLADVVGALPKYQMAIGHIAKVVMPMYRTSFLYNNEWEVVHKGAILFGESHLQFTVIKEKSDFLKFNLFCIDIHGLLDRQKIYGYDDDNERFLAFQLSVIEWISKWELKPDVVHVHDYHAGLIPFFMRYCYDYRHLNTIKTVLTIHNAQYQGWMNWSFTKYFPVWDSWKAGLLEWNNQINPLACAIKCADKVNTVSPTYMKELMNKANGLESLFEFEKGKCSGIINGIDNSVWNPKTDSLIHKQFDQKNIVVGKRKNKQKLCTDFGFDESLPLIIFIGRLVGEKAADLLPEAISTAFEKSNKKFNCLILGNGDKTIEKNLSEIHQQWFGYYHSQIEYNEKLSHQMYAGADFLLMPSRVEPCGLNQLYAMRYGTIPIVRRTGGLNDTVIDIGDNGYGICFNNASVEDIVLSIIRAIKLYENTDMVNDIRNKMIKINTSWEKSAQDYIDLYHSIYR
ncbi:MAG: glycogen/starch synthase [Bacteroidota bacterium]